MEREGMTMTATVTSIRDEPTTITQEDADRAWVAGHIAKVCAYAVWELSHKWNDRITDDCLSSVHYSLLHASSLAEEAGNLFHVIKEEGR
jgi:hypothetical protein